MLWHTTPTRVYHQGIQDGILYVLEEDVEAVLSTLLKTPDTTQEKWSDEPDSIDLTRLEQLTTKGVLNRVCFPTRTPSGAWGFRLGARLNSDDARAQLSYFTKQLNRQAGLVDYLSQANTGSLLWFSDTTSRIRGERNELRTSWALAPATNFLSLRALEGAANTTDTVVTTSLIEQATPILEAQPLSGGFLTEVGFDVPASQAVLEDLLVQRLSPVSTAETE